MSDTTVQPSDPERPAIRVWRVGPLAVLLAGGLLLANVVAFFWDGDSDIRTSILVGLSFGQAGAAACWVFARSIRRRLLFAACAIGFAAVMGGYFALADSTRADAREVAGIGLLFMLYAIEVLALRALLQLALARWGGAPAPRWTPQFGVAHLLAAMVAIALIALAIRMALPMLGEFADPETIGLISGWAIIATAAGWLLLDYPLVLWRLGAFAAASLVVTIGMIALLDWDVVPFANAIQVVVLVIALWGPQLGRYTMQITFEPRELGTDNEAEAPPLTD